MLSTLSPLPAPAANTGQPGRLFNAEDFALADLSPMEIWDRMVTIAVREHASDVHLCCQRDGVHVGLRMDGRIYGQGIMPAELGARLANHSKVLANMDVSEKRRPQDGHLAMTIDGREIDLRVSLLPTNHGEDVALRVLDRTTSELQLNQLGVSEQQLRDLMTMISSPSGLILVSGATGTGKTTTLYAALKHLADGTRKVVTIENPLEFDLPGVNQTEVNYRIGVDYAALIRSVLRHDPNVIMIGEIRDSETAEAVVRAANCGRLVLATSHAVHSAGAIDGLVNLGAHRHFIARSFRGIVAQTLVRRLCPYCTIRLEETAGAGMLDDVRHLLGPSEKPVLSMGRGCPHCRHTGYRGRVGIFEIMAADDEMRDMIARGATSREIYGYASQNKMITIAQAGKLATLRGLTTIEELLENISEIWTGTRGRRD